MKCERTCRLQMSLLPGAVANVQVRLSEAAVAVEGLAQVEALAVLEGEHQVDLGYIGLGIGTGQK